MTDDMDMLMTGHAFTIDGERVDPHDVWTQEEWDAWHNPPCPPVEQHEVYAVTRCVTLDPLLALTSTELYLPTRAELIGRLR